MDNAVEISVVTPFYNEASIIETAIRTMLEQLETLDGEWELIVVADGPTDGSIDIARQIEHPRLQLIEYSKNRCRGYALRTGIEAAKGDLIVTTEIDLSWGERIVHELVAALRNNPDADFIVASPHLPGGSYRNVPAKRVFFSKFGNRVIRALMSYAATMNTGMTRAYRREMIRSMPLHEDEKEFHLEVMLKAGPLGYQFAEIPATLEWKNYKHQGKRVVRKSSSVVNRLIVTHTLFSIFATPVRYAWSFSIVSFIVGVLFSIYAVIFYLTGEVSAYTALMGVLLVILAIILFMMGVVMQQGNMIQKEIWLLQRERQSQRRRENNS
jgi:glycosyltransferase involved in cell wall biosynthesis